MGIERAEVIAKMRGAFRAKVGVSRFIADMRAVGLAYRHTDMLADWSNINQLETKKDLLKYIRKGYAPAERTVELKGWAMSKEYMYKIRCQQIFAGVPADKPTFINLMHDAPQTIEALEHEAWERTFPQSPPKTGEERVFSVESAIHRAEI